MAIEIMIEEILKNNPLLFTIILFVNSLLIGTGAGMGLYKGIQKLFDYWVSIKINTDQIPVLVKKSEKNMVEQKREIKNLKKILQEHDLEVKEEIRKIS